MVTVLLSTYKPDVQTTVNNRLSNKSPYQKRGNVNAVSDISVFCELLLLLLMTMMMTTVADDGNQRTSYLQVHHSITSFHHILMF